MNLEIATRLQKLRKEKGYSQEELADKLGISRQAVSKWERAEASPDTDNLIMLAKLYNISLDELLSVDLENNIEKNKSLEKDRDKESEYIKNEDLEQFVVENNSDNIKNNDSDKNRFYNIFQTGFILLIVFLYILIGSVFSLWHPGWLLFFFIPLMSTLVESIKKKKTSEFAFPILITVIYLWLGFEFGLWHPYWCLYLLVPIYYLVSDFIDKKKQN